MATPVREIVLTALANKLGAVRNPYAIDFDSARVVALYDAEESITQDYDTDVHELVFRVTAIDACTESQDRSVEANRLLAWLYQTTLAELTLGGVCEAVRVTALGPAYSDDPSDFVGAMLEGNVVYRTGRGDPYTAA